MTEERILAQALRKTDPAERAVFLEEACTGDPDLRARVEERLRRLAEPATSPQAPDVRTRTPDVGAGAETTAEAGRRIGPYKLLNELGEGGMGTVWLADQDEPIARRVAVKLIKAGMDSAQVIARFEAERQALTLMDHPNIARVLDAGTTEAGRPYFVMELVKGIPITRFCDEEHLTPRQRLELFLPVCRAVQHAHQKGIIHRDLKPSNILVARYDDKPVPKVIDFGLAKAAGQRLTERTLFTEVGSLMGTLEYMAPEQAEVNNLDIDTRADIYSLGVILYELLTGGPPFPGKQLRDATYTEMLRILREVEPLRPSVRLRKDQDGRMRDEKKTRVNRFSSFILHPSSFQEVDWIVMKCLEKERARRYETVNALVLDLEHYLADEPILAGPVSRIYRLRKFLRRHRGAVLAAGLLLLALLAGVVGTTIGLIEARQQWAAAEAARTHEAEQRRRAEEAGALARRNAAATREVVQQFLIRVGDDRLAELPDFDLVRKQLIDLAVKHYRELLRQQPDDTALRSDAAQAFRRSAHLSALIGRAAEARTLYDEAAAAAEEVVQKEPASVDYRRRLAETLCDLGTHVLHAEGPREAEAVFRQALAMGRQLQTMAGADPNVIVLVARTETDLGDVLRQRGQDAEAIRLSTSAAQTFSDLADRPRSNPVHRLLAAYAWANVAQAAREADKPAEADGAVQQAVRRAEAVRRLNPRDPNLRYGLARARLEAGRHWATQAGRDKETAAALDEAVALLEQLTAESPQLTSFGRQLAVALTTRGRWHLAHDRRAEATADARLAIHALDNLEKQTKQAKSLNALYVAALTLAAKAALPDDKEAVAPLLATARRRLEQARAFNPEDRALQQNARELEQLGVELTAGK